MPDLDDFSEDEIAEGVRDFVMFLEEADSTECVYTWNTLMKSSLLLYDFSKGKRDASS